MGHVGKARPTALEERPRVIITPSGPGTKTPRFLSEECFVVNVCGRNLVSVETTTLELEQEIKQSIRPAWLKIDDAVRFSGIGRSKLYSLIDDGKIRSACLRERDKTRGTRIVNVRSLEAYISAHEDVWSESPNPKAKNEGPK
jgi:helix-turn-helix protein